MRIPEETQTLVALSKLEELIKAEPLHWEELVKIACRNLPRKKKKERKKLFGKLYQILSHENKTSRLSASNR